MLSAETRSALAKEKDNIAKQIAGLMQQLQAINDLLGEKTAAVKADGTPAKKRGRKPGRPPGAKKPGPKPGAKKPGRRGRPPKALSAAAVSTPGVKKDGTPKAKPGPKPGSKRGPKPRSAGA